MMSGALQGKVLLATDRNGEHNKLGMVLLHMHPTAGHSVLPGLNVTGEIPSHLEGASAPYSIGSWGHLQTAPSIGTPTILMKQSIEPSEEV